MSSLDEDEGELPMLIFEFLLLFLLLFGFVVV